MATKIERNSQKSIVEVMKELSSSDTMKLGIEEIEFPGGTKEKFFYNGEQDKQDCIHFATICINATTTDADARKLMFQCFKALTQGVHVDVIIKLKSGKTLYLDKTQKALYDENICVYVTLTDEEKKKRLSIDALEMVLKERAEKRYSDEYNRDRYVGYDYDDDECPEDCRECEYVDTCDHYGKYN
jgi:hypothetical protein